MRLQGIRTDEEEIRDFQAVFPATKAAGLLAKIIGKVEEGFDLRLRGLGTPDPELRQAQGGCFALQELLSACRFFMSVDLSDVRDEDEVEEEVQDGPDIGY